jgi:hypothetical protein
MTVPTVSCTNCGTNFTTDDLRGTSCKYCGTLLAHHARAAQQVAVINQMMADRNGNGIPDAYEGVIANAQANALNQAFGMGVPPYGQPMGGVPMSPMMGPAMHMHAANVHVAQATRTISNVMIFVAVGIGVMALVIVGVVVAMMFMLGGS